MLKIPTLTLAASALALVTATSLAAAGIIMPTRSIAAMQMHSAPTASPSLGPSRIRTPGGLIDPNDRNTGGHFERKGAPVNNVTTACTKDPTKCSG